MTENQQSTVVQPRVNQTMIIPGAVKPRHIEVGSALVKFGMADDRPDDGSVYPVYFAIDTNVMSVYNGTAWKTTTFS
jgi:hypothetical protein